MNKLDALLNVSLQLFDRSLNQLGLVVRDLANA